MPDRLTYAIGATAATCALPYRTYRTSIFAYFAETFVAYATHEDLAG